jgi:hypothetical protein
LYFWFNCANKCWALFFAPQKIAPRGFEPLNENQQPVDNKALTENQNPVLATSLDKILQKHPDLALVVERWPNLSDTIKQAVKTLVESQK